MVSQVLTNGLVLFNLSHPAHNFCREILVDILTCFKCYQLEDHPTTSCPKSKEYKIYVPLKKIHMHPNTFKVLTANVQSLPPKIDELIALSKIDTL